MSAQRRARVRRRFEVHPRGFDYAMQAWMATVYVNGKPQFGTQATAFTHAEALQAAYKLLADLDAELMAEVHESHASRRAVTPKPCDCTDCTEIRRAAAALGEATA